MAQRLKRWESPRRQGRNDKGRGGSARQRQKRKQLQRLRQTLAESSEPNAPGTFKSDQFSSGNAKSNRFRKGGDDYLLPFSLGTWIYDGRLD